MSSSESVEKRLLRKEMGKGRIQEKRKSGHVSTSAEQELMNDVRAQGNFWLRLIFKHTWWQQVERSFYTLHISLFNLSNRSCKRHHSHRCIQRWNRENAQVDVPVSALMLARFRAVFRLVGLFNLICNAAPTECNLNGSFPFLLAQCHLNEFTPTLFIHATPAQPSRHIFNLIVTPAKRFSHPCWSGCFLYTHMDIWIWNKKTMQVLKHRLRWIYNYDFLFFYFEAMTFMSYDIYMTFYPSDTFIFQNLLWPLRQKLCPRMW